VSELRWETRGDEKILILRRRKSRPSAGEPPFMDTNYTSTTN